MRPSTRALTGLSKMPATTGLDQTRTAIRGLGRASGRSAEALRTGSWSTDARDRVNTLIAALLDQQTFLDDLAAKPDMDAIRAASSQTGQTLLTTRACAAALEKVLGIGDGMLGLAPSSSGTS